MKEDCELYFLMLREINISATDLFFLSHSLYDKIPLYDKYSAS